MEKGNDISKRTVLVLLVLTLVVSVVGTWTVLSQPTTIHKIEQHSGPQEAKVKLSIYGPVEPVVPEAAGKVSLNIDNG